MTRKDYFVLFAAGLLAVLAVAALQRSPGYMDAEYYLLTGQELAAGRGLNEPVLWNYLDEPAGLPHSSHSYWMPLPSFVAAAGAWLLDGGGFNGGRVFFILLAAALPPLTARLAFALTRRRGTARLAGWLAVLPGFYLPYLSTTDSFSLSMLLGGLFFLVLIEARPGARGAVALGALAGLLHLARAEGPLWLLLALAAVWPRNAAWALGGYLFTMGPWLLRNLGAFGSFFPPGTTRALWLTQYDELFSFPASQLNLQSWLASGWNAILTARLNALGQNLSSALVVSGLVALAPLAVWGVWKLRTHAAVRAGAAAWLGLLLLMSFVFPFSGARGGFFHAAAALQPLAWTLAAVGLGALAEWGSARRGWQATQAAHIFSLAALVLALAMSVYAVQARVLRGEWNASADHYQQVGQGLDALGIATSELILVNNPPGFTLATGRPAIVIPHGGRASAAAAAQQYGARILVLEANHQANWDEVYARPYVLSSIQWLDTIDGTHILRLP